MYIKLSMLLSHLKTYGNQHTIVLNVFWRKTRSKTSKNTLFDRQRSCTKVCTCSTLANECQRNRRSIDICTHVCSYRALDFISDTAKAAIEKRWTEEKMCYREGRTTIWSKASDSGPIRRLWNLVLSTLEFLRHYCFLVWFNSWTCSCIKFTLVLFHHSLHWGCCLIRFNRM